MPAGLTDINIEASYTYVSFIRELKIVSDYCYEGFIRQVHNRAQIDGLFYANMILYLPNYYHPIFTKVLRMYKGGTYVDNVYT